MIKLMRIFQYAYLVIGILFLVEGVLAFNKNRERALFMFGFAIFIILIFFFKRRFTKKIEKRNAQK